MANDKTKMARTTAKVGTAALTGNLPSLAYELVGNKFIDGISARNRRKAEKWSEQLADELRFALDTDGNAEIHRLLQELENYPEAEAELYETIEDMLNSRSQDIAPRIYALVSAKILSERKVLDSAHRVILESVGEFTDKELEGLMSFVAHHRKTPQHQFPESRALLVYLSGGRPERISPSLGNFTDWAQEYGEWAPKAQRFRLVVFHSTTPPDEGGRASMRSRRNEAQLTPAVLLLNDYFNKVRLIDTSEGEM